MDQELYDLHIVAGATAGRERTCGKKVAYPDEDSGLRAAVGMNEKPTEAYPCAFCGKWHLGRAMSLAELTSYITPKPGASLARLVDVMDRLLAPDGCPWDREQTLETLRPFIVEETYEVLDALSRSDVPGHCEELGDLLMQIVFHAAIRRAEGAFGIDDVVNGIADKLVHRHPHVFADTKVADSAEVLRNWEAIKAEEKAANGTRTDRILAGVKPGPALARAQKIGQKCGKVGFDWPGWEGSFAKIVEETAEVKAAIESVDQAAIHAELGDLFFAVMNVARKVGVDAEQALIDATGRFQRRFEFVEDRLRDRGKTPQMSNLEEMDALWNDAKKAGVA